MSLYQELRPVGLDGIVGNTITVKALKNMLGSRNRPHTILLTGESGCGKTTIARILAKEFGSDKLGFIELNASNTRGIDTVREMIEDSQFKTIGGGVKTYLIDECHQITPQAQEAMLKLIEDTPEHCYFILSTTDPQKLITTIRNRCSSYQLSKLNEKELHVLLENACKAKKLDISDDVKEAIVQTCEGSPRAALVALEKVIGITDLDEAIKLVVQSTQADKNVIDLCKLLIQMPKLRREKWKQIINTFDGLEGEPEQIRKAICTFMYNKLVKCEKEEIALNIAWLLELFSTNAYYGGKTALVALIIKACLNERNVMN